MRDSRDVIRCPLSLGPGASVTHAFCEGQWGFIASIPAETNGAPLVSAGVDFYRSPVDRRARECNWWIANEQGEQQMT